MPIVPIEIDNPSRYQELLETLAGQVHRDFVRKYPEELWKIRYESLPYDSLTEEQKALVRIAAKENLDELLGAGIRIEAPRTPESDLQEERYQVEALLKQGEPILAYDSVRRALKNYPEDVYLRQLQALSLIRTGGPAEALGVLRQLLKEGHRDQGTLAPLARALRDLGERTSEPESRRRCLERAFELYEEAYRSNRGMWSGVQAAWLALELGHGDRAAELAALVGKSVRETLKKARAEGTDTFWLQAILGIAAILQRRFSQGYQCFEQLVEIGRERSGDVAEVRHMARSILALLGEDAAPLERIMPSPKVVVFAGHMVDFADRKEPRFPPSLVEAVAGEIRDRISGLRLAAGFASAASGAPILFHEAVLAMGGETHVVLPYGQNEFFSDSVAIREDMDWNGRYERVLEKAKRVIVTSPQRLDEGSVVFRYANRLLLGLAMIRAQQLRCELLPLVVWDGRPSSAAGSVAQTLNDWRKLGHSVEVIDIRKLRQGHLEVRKRTRHARVAAKLPAGLSTQTMIMLFADVVHFSRMQERQMPLFIAHFLEAIGRIEKDLDLRPTLKNTWGDGLFLVFRKAGDAIRYGRSLLNCVSGTDWDALGLPADLNLRVALHAGPVYMGRDPVTGRRTCYGTHVNSAARIEPITPPGKIYVSQAFAALVTALRLKDCACEYAGQMPLAKNFGVFPMYVLQTGGTDAEDLETPSSIAHVSRCS
jgi:class 3 adenylate cyclase